MLTGLRTRVSAGTQMTPQHQLGLNNQPLRRLSQDAAPEMKLTENISAGQHRSASVCHGTHMSPGTDVTNERSRQHEVPAKQGDEGPDMRVRKESAKASGGANVKQAGARGSKQVLSDATNKQRSQRKQQTENPPVLGKENVQLAVEPVLSNRRSKQKRTEQVWHMLPETHDALVR